MEQLIRLTGFSDEIDPGFDIQLQTIKKLGLKYIELRGVDGINVADLTAEQQEITCEKLKAHGISVSCIGSPIGKIGITEPFEPHFAQFCDLVSFAKKLGTHYIRIFSFYIPEGEKPGTYTDEVLRRLEALAVYAKEAGVILLHENEKGIYGDTPARCKVILDRLYDTSFQAVFDFANFVQCGSDTQEAYQLLAPYIKYIHIKDALLKDGSIVPAGQGDGCVAAILKALKESGYRGFLSLEPHLVDFTGLSDLEATATERNSALSGEAAWRMALNALKALLWDLDWR